jgi:hypothetical protein
MLFSQPLVDTCFLPELDIDDGVQHQLIAGCHLIYARDPFAPERILGCRMEPGRGLVPLFGLFEPGAEDRRQEGTARRTRARSALGLADGKGEQELRADPLAQGATEPGRRPGEANRSVGNDR